MNSAVEDNYNSKYYATHKDEIRERRKKRYEDDEEYRQQCIERAKSRYKKNRKKIRKANRKQSMAVWPGGEQEKAYQIAELSEAIGKRPFTIRDWIRRRLIPDSPLKRSRIRYYTPSMIKVVKKALPDTFRKDWDTVFADILDGWEDLGVFDDGVEVKSV